MKEMIEMYVENEKISELKKELQELLEVYQNNRQFQGKLTALSVKLSDEVARVNSVPSIADKEKRQYQKQRKLLLNEIGITTTLEMNLTEHIHQLSDEEEQQILAEINEIYEKLFKIEDKKEFKQLHKQYLELKQKLNEPQSFDYQNINLAIKPRQIEIKSYDKKSIKYALRYFDVIDVEAKIDITQALSIADLTDKQQIILNKWMISESLTSDETVHLKNAVDKIVYALNNENIYKKI